MRLSTFFFFLTGVFLAVMASSGCHLIQAPTRSEEVSVIVPQSHPDGKPWKTEDKLEYIEFIDEPFKNVLQSLSTGFGLNITVPKTLLDRVVAFRLKDVTCQQIISYILKNTEFEPVFQQSDVIIRIKTEPNQRNPDNSGLRPFVSD